jgi:hypothetical protein
VIGMLRKADGLFHRDLLRDMRGFGMTISKVS